MELATGGAAAHALAPGPEETLDELLRGRIRVLQPRRGARVSQDALLLADFALTTGGGGRLGRVLDLCCGGGVIALALATADAGARLCGVELQPAFVALAQRNAQLNGVADRLAVVAGDVTKPRALPLEPQAFDLVVSNPPFQPATGYNSGRVAPSPERALARAEVACALADVVASARHFLRPRGRLAMVHSADRLADLLATLVAADLRPRVVRPVHSVAGERALRVLVEAVRDYRGGVSMLAPLVIHEADRRSRTAEAAQILG